MHRHYIPYQYQHHPQTSIADHYQAHLQDKQRLIHPLHHLQRIHQPDHHQHQHQHHHSQHQQQQAQHHQANSTTMDHQASVPQKEHNHDTSQAQPQTATEDKKEIKFLKMLTLMHYSNQQQQQTA